VAWSGPNAYAATLTAPGARRSNPRPAPPIARCSISATAPFSPEGSSFRWMKIGGQVQSLGAYHRKDQIWPQRQTFFPSDF
jgi:hypothetical protein